MPSSMPKGTFVPDHQDRGVCIPYPSVLGKQESSDESCDPFYRGHRLAGEAHVQHQLAFGG
jgi:hypothetical protein